MVDILRNIGQLQLRDYGTCEFYLVHDTVEVRRGGIALVAIKRVNVQDNRRVVIAGSIDVRLI